MRSRERRLPQTRWRAPTLGPRFSTGEIRRQLDLSGAVYTELEDAELFMRLAEVLEQEAVVGWFQGRMEFGPRSLGGRSIIGDPRSEKMQSVMNLKIKYRESFRPFAPAVLAEDVSRYFELDRPSPYMLIVAPVRDELRVPMTAEQQQLFGIEKLHLRRSSLPAITHVDYSARIQTVHRETNPRFHALLSCFRERTGCSVLVNTSFNVRGEPIVCTPEDAYRCFMRTEMDYLVVENFPDGEDGSAGPGERRLLEERIRAGLNPMTAQSSNAPVNLRQLREFGLVFAAGLVVMFGLLLPWLAGRPWPLWPWVAAAVFVTLALVFPPALGPLNALWLKIGHMLGWINTRIILGVVFFVVFLPAGLLMRVLHKDPMHRKFDASADKLPRAQQIVAEQTNGETLLMIDLLKDLWAFMKVRKKFWLAPIIIILLLLGALIVLTQGSAVAPFIYTLF